MIWKIRCFFRRTSSSGQNTLAKELIKSEAAYYNWDDLASRSIIPKNQIDSNSKLLILGEIHKYRLWRNLVKGYFDKNIPDSNLLVTGSARLDHFRKGGDSLVGRYHYYRMHPFSLPEVSKKCENDLLQGLLKDCRCLFNWFRMLPNTSAHFKILLRITISFTEGFSGSCKFSEKTRFRFFWTVFNSSLLTTL